LICDLLMISSCSPESVLLIPELHGAWIPKDLNSI
jgi:hypothetical protein